MLTNFSLHSSFIQFTSLLHSVTFWALTYGGYNEKKHMKKENGRKTRLKDPYTVSCKRKKIEKK